MAVYDSCEGILKRTRADRWRLEGYLGIATLIENQSIAHRYLARLVKL